MILLLIC